VFSGGDSPAGRDDRGVSITTNDPNNMHAFLQKFHGGGHDHLNFGDSMDSNIYNTEAQYRTPEQALGSGVATHQIAARVITTSQNNRDS
jgi:hypothetical protein